MTTRQRQSQPLPSVADPGQMAATLYQLWLGAAMLTKLRRDASALQTAWQATLDMLQLSPDSYR